VIVTVLHVNFWFGHFSGEVSFQFVIYIGGSRIFRGGDCGNPSERSERALMDLARGGAQNDIEITSVTRIIITRNRLPRQGGGY